MFGMKRDDIRKKNSTQKDYNGKIIIFSVE